MIRFESNADPRWNCAGDGIAMTVSCDAATKVAQLRVAGEVRRKWSDPLEALDWMVRNEALHPADPARFSRWAGYISYDLVRLIEDLPAAACDDLRVPLFAFGLVVAGKPRSLAQVDPPHERHSAASNFTRVGYEAAVQRVLDYISAGDAYQVNLAQRFTAGVSEPALNIYSRLQQRAPAKYAAFLDFGDFQVASNSPELFFEVYPRPDGSRSIVSRPMKGTRPRGDGMFDELLRSEKDKAELAMIVDLVRNDLGRVCEIGTVQVTDPRTIEEHPTVYQGVATIQGALRREVRASDLLRALFPCGSVTGCPKIRAMQIVDELEPVARGPYCGAIGYIGADGSMRFSVAIRTMIVRNGVAHIPVGGGIVADSSPDGEYAETLVKAQAMFEAVGVAVDCGS